MHMRRQSIAMRNSRSRELSSVTVMPPTLAYSWFVQKASQRPLLETVIAAMMKRWQVREVKMNVGIREVI